MALDDSTIRILIHTDSHLGFCERDAIRCDDSFAAFEEALFQAKERKVDFVIHAGDMFHENKPSRRTLHAAMEIFRRNCLGEDAIYTEILSEQGEVFKANAGKVNYEDPFQSISLPYFAVHGNHDDPTREGGSGDALAALDLLAVSNLINYFGKCEDLDEIEVTPILFRKNGCMVALYGLGAIRDERLNRLWAQKKVRFVRPSEEQNREHYFCIFVLHQNRDFGRGRKNCVHESMIPQWMDLVIWGNEHESLPLIQESLVGTFRIYQPGSSVATSLNEGESDSHRKHYGFLEIRPSAKDQPRSFRLRSFMYSQTRPFVYGDITLADEGLALDEHVDEKIKKLLERKVSDMIKDAKQRSQEVADQAEHFSLVHRVREPHLVLVRLRVDHTGFAALNQNRFGQMFTGKVANASEILFFAKKKKDFVRQPGEAGAKRKGTAHEKMKEGIEEGDREAIDLIRIEDLVAETLTGNRQLCLLPEADMAQALDDFVNKKITSAIADIVTESLEHTQSQLWKDASLQAIGKGDIKEAAEKVKQKVEEDIRKGERPAQAREPRSRTRMSDSEDDSVGGRRGGESDEDDDNSTGGGKQKKKPAASKGKAAAGGGGRGKKAAEPKTTAARGKGAAATKTKAAAAAGKKGKGKKSDDEDEDEEEEEEEEIDELDEDSYSARPRGKKSSMAKGSGKPSSAKAPPASVRKSSRASSHVAKSYAERDDDDDDVIIEDEDDEEERGGDVVMTTTRNTPPASSSSSSSSSSRGGSASSRGASSSGAAPKVVNLADDSGDEDQFTSSLRSDSNFGTGSALTATEKSIKLTGGGGGGTASQATGSKKRPLPNSLSQKSSASSSKKSRDDWG